MKRLSLLLATLFLSLVVLHAQTPATPLDSTKNLQQAQSSDPIANLEPDDLLVRDRTIYIDTETFFIPLDVMQKALMNQKDWKKVHVKIVGDPKVADMKLKIDRVVFTHIHTFVLSDERSSIVLGAGQVRALDGIIASGDLANQVLKTLLETRRQTALAKERQE
jgi:hypothetical protein